MNIDFSWMDSIGSRGEPQVNPGAVTGLEKLFRETGKEIAQKERYKAVYAEYQRSITASATAKAEILKGIQGGENVYALLLQACEALAQATGDELFYKQARRDLTAVYGHGFGEAKPVELEAQEVEERLNRLRRALKDERDAVTFARLQQAEKTHRERLADLERIRKRSGGAYAQS